MAPRPIPTAEQLDALDASLTRHIEHAEALVLHLRHQAAVCRDHPSRPDGFPRRASGAGTSTTTGGGGQAPDDDGDPVELTSVEAAVEGRARHRDPLERAVLDGVVGLERALAGFQALGAAVASFAALRTPQAVDVANAEVGCWVLARVGHHEPIHVSATTLNGLLDVERPVSRWAYDFAREVGRLPTLDECEQRAERLTVRLSPPL